MGRRRLLPPLFALLALATPCVAHAADVNINLGAGQLTTLIADEAEEPAPTRMMARVGLSAAEAPVIYGVEGATLRPDPERSWRNRVSPNVSIITSSAQPWALDSADGEASSTEFRLTLGATLRPVSQRF